MKALVLEEKGRLSLREFPQVLNVGAHDVKIAVHTVGICGSDVHYYTHGKIGPFVVRERRFCCTAHGHRFGVIHQPQGQVEDMYADIDAWPAATVLLVDKRRAERQ